MQLPEDAQTEAEDLGLGRSEVLRQYLEREPLPRTQFDHVREVLDLPPHPFNTRLMRGASLARVQAP